MSSAIAAVGDRASNGQALELDALDRALDDWQAATVDVVASPPTAADRVTLGLLGLFDLAIADDLARLSALEAPAEAQAPAEAELFSLAAQLLGEQAADDATSSTRVTSAVSEAVKQALAEPPPAGDGFGEAGALSEVLGQELA